MTNEQFLYWLKGILDGLNPSENNEVTNKIKDKLNSVINSDKKPPTHPIFRNRDNFCGTIIDNQPVKKHNVDFPEKAAEDIFL